MAPVIRFLLAALRVPPSEEWWVTELDRLLRLFEERLALPGYAWGELHNHATRARTQDARGYDLDGLATELRAWFTAAVDPGVHEDLALLDVVLARLGHATAGERVGRMVGLSLAVPPRGSLDEPATMMALHRQLPKRL